MILVYQKEKVLPVSKYLGVLIEQCLQIQLAAKSQYVHIKLMFYSIKLIIYSLKIASGFEILVNNLNQLIFEIILPRFPSDLLILKILNNKIQEFQQNLVPIAFIPANLNQQIHGNHLNILSVQCKILLSSNKLLGILHPQLFIPRR